MVEIDRGDDGAQGLVDDIGGVIGSAHAGFEQQEVGRCLGKKLEGRGGRHLEKGNGAASIEMLDPFESGIELAGADQSAGEANALVETHQMRRIIDMDALSRRFEKGAEIGDGRALGIGAGNVDHRRQALLRIAHIGEQTQNTFEAEIDQLGMQTGQALQNGVGAGHRELRARQTRFCAACLAPTGPLRQGAGRRWRA